MSLTEKGKKVILRSGKGRKMPKVYIVQEVMTNRDGQWGPAHDYTPAQAYGNIEIIIPQNKKFSPFAMIPTINFIRDQLRGFNPEDYLLLAGDPTLIAISAIIAFEKTVGNVNFLKYDRQTKSYIKCEAKFFK